MAIRLGGFTSLVHECEMEALIQVLAHNRKSEGATVVWWWTRLMAWTASRPTPLQQHAPLLELTLNRRHQHVMCNSYR